MDDKWISRRTSLNFEDAFDCRFVCGISAETVNSFGGEGYGAAGAEEGGCVRN